MAIQFKCVSCSNTVEVDDAWGGRLVECPYCHETITAPAFAASPPAARPVGHSQPVAHTPTFEQRESYSAPQFGTPPYPAYAPPASTSNKVAVAALVLAITSLVIGFMSMLPVWGALSRDLGPDVTEQQAQAYVQKAAESGAPWVMKAVFGIMGSCGLWLAGLVCGIIGVCKPTKRWIAVVALVVLLLPMMLMLFSALV